MYLLILENFAVRYTDVIDDNDIRRSENGFIDLIDIRDPRNPLIYRGQWVPVQHENNEW